MLNKELKVINLGLKTFEEALKMQNVEVINIDWKPPAEGDKKLIDSLLKVKKQNVLANKEAITRINNSVPVLVGLEKAKDVIPNMSDNLILHAGPPIEWKDMCGPMKGAIIGALIYEGKASNFNQAIELVEKGDIKFSPCHHHNAVGPMAGIISPSMYVWIIKNETYGNYAYSNINEGLGKVLRFGAYDNEVIDRLKWIEQELSPILKDAIELSNGINIKNIITQALLMGDECHNRNVAATSMFLRELLPYILSTKYSKEKIKNVIEFINKNNHFFLNISMAACKATMDTIAGIKYSSIVSIMARNGVKIGIQVAGLKNKWFIWDAGEPKGLYFTGFSEKDANKDLGDSTISEVAGIGAVAMAAAPAIVKFIGGTPQDAIKYTKEMYEITFSKHSQYKIPYLNFEGTPLGFDVCSIVETGITPIINTGIAHKEPGIGQIGAGILRAPLELFKLALLELANT